MQRPVYFGLLEELRYTNYGLFLKLTSAHLQMLLLLVVVLDLRLLVEVEQLVVEQLAKVEQAKLVPVLKLLVEVEQLVPLF